MKIIDKGAFFTFAHLSGSLERAAIAGRATPAAATAGGLFVDPASGASARLAADHGAETAEAHFTSKNRDLTGLFALTGPDSQWKGSPCGAPAAI